MPNKWAPNRKVVVCWHSVGGVTTSNKLTRDTWQSLKCIDKEHVEMKTNCQRSCGIFARRTLICEVSLLEEKPGIFLPAFDNEVEEVVCMEDSHK